jgi:hypothetical protein
MKKKYSFERNSGTDVNIVAKKKKSKRLGIFPRLLCLIVAMFIWLYVMYTRRADFEVVIEDVPIELQGADRILNKYGLEVADDDFTVDITIRGKKSVIETYTIGNVKAYVDIRNISDAGEFTVKIKYQIPYYSFITVSTDIDTITVTTQWAEELPDA